MLFNLLWIIIYCFAIYLLSFIGLICCELIRKEHNKRFFHKTYEDLIMIVSGFIGLVYIVLAATAKYGAIITTIIFIGYFLSLIS